MDSNELCTLRGDSSPGDKLVLYYLKTDFRHLKLPCDRIPKQNARCSPRLNETLL